MLETHPVLLGTLGSLLAGAMTSVGALPVFFGREIPTRVEDALLGFAAGVMLAASFFSLLIPSLEASAYLYGSNTIAASIAVLGLIVGVAAIAWINENVPHEHFLLGPEGPDTAALRKIWLFVIAITIHNFPEGLAVGIGFGAGDMANGMPLAIGIGLQNAPEGLAVAVALASQGYTRMHAFLIASASGAVEPVGGLLGAGAVFVSEPLLPWGLAFAAGAMLYVISHEIIPETHSRGNQNQATTGLVIGLVAMMFLDVTLG
jgi:ZIP family zinc transporter